MEVQSIALLISAVILAVLAAAVLLQRRDQSEAVRRMEQLERRLGEALHDLRSEQSALARAARLESQAAGDRLSEQIDKRVARLADMTDQSLERIRHTVDERLDVSLEQNFSRVSRQLREVHITLGQVQSLSAGVDELKRVLSNVKVRGIWGEMQLGNLLQDILDRGRFAENVEVRPGSGLRVEYALRLPGQGQQELLLPIDAKFPLEDYQRLQQAREAGDAAAAAAALKQLERRLKSEAKDISEKYICPPYSTDFAVMYLPCEGLFAEALSIAGLAETLQSRHRVCVAGPNTLAALVNSLQLGFRTLAVQQRTAEVWQLLYKVKQEMEGLQAALDKSGKKLEEAQQALHTAGRRAAGLSRQLDAVQEEQYGTGE